MGDIDVPCSMTSLKRPSSRAMDRIESSHNLPHIIICLYTGHLVYNTPKSQKQTASERKAYTVFPLISLSRWNIFSKLPQNASFIPPPYLEMSKTIPHGCWWRHCDWVVTEGLCINRSDHGVSDMLQHQPPALCSTVVLSQRQRQNLKHGVARLVASLTPEKYLQVEIIRGRHIGSPTNDRLGPESRVYLQVWTGSLSPQPGENAKQTDIVCKSTPYGCPSKSATNQIFLRQRRPIVEVHEMMDGWSLHLQETFVSIISIISIY